MSLHLHKSNAIIFHIPKTGGTWIHRALEAGKVNFIPFHEFSPHNTPDQEPTLENKYTIAFVRHPITYYKSYWAFRIETGWTDGWYLDDTCKSKRFEIFVKNIINNNVPYVTNEYRKYWCYPQKLNFIGKTENLKNDLIHILRFLNEDFDEKAISTLPKQNTTKTKAECSKELLHKLIDLEKEIIDYFKYPKYIE
jgi:hypothetical protein